jgi:hypothetical protein
MNHTSPDKLLSSVRTGDVQVKFADGTEHTLPIHGITQLQMIRLLDELGIKSFDELKSAEPTLQMVRFMTRAAAHALTFEKTQDIWNLERIKQSFADMEQISKVFLACVSLSALPKAPKGESQMRKQAPYHQ